MDCFVNESVDSRRLLAQVQTNNAYTRSEINQKKTFRRINARKTDHGLLFSILLLFAVLYCTSMLELLLLSNYLSNMLRSIRWVCSFSDIDYNIEYCNINSIYFVQFEQIVSQKLHV